MNKKPRFLIQFVCFAAVFLAILLQSFTGFVKMNPLQGFDKEEPTPVALTFKTYYDGSYQGYLTEHTKRNTGFREFFIRSYNQMAYSCFGKITNDNIVEGRNHELYLKMYLNDITGKTIEKDFGTVDQAKVVAQNNVEETLRLIDTLHRHGTEFLFVFAPSKTWVYPENMPKAYRQHVSDFSLEEYYIQLFKKNGIAHIDFLDYFRNNKEALKNTPYYPLFPRTGTHWAEATIPLVADSILKKLSAITDYSLPSIHYVDENLTTDYSVQDGELEASMNLLFPLKKPAIPKPIFTLADTIGKDKPNLLVIADSYFVQLRISDFSKAFNHWDYWAYNRDVQASRKEYQWMELKYLADAPTILKEADIVLALFTAPMFYNYMFGFTQSAQELYQKGEPTFDDLVQMTIHQIKLNPKWMNAVEKQAAELGISVEENLMRNAKYVVEMKQTKASQND